MFAIVLSILCNYITKVGISSYNAIAYAIAAFQKHELYNNKTEDDQDYCRKLIYRTFNAAASQTEYSGAQVSNMLQKMVSMVPIILLKNSFLYVMVIS